MRAGLSMVMLQRGFMAALTGRSDSACLVESPNWQCLAIGKGEWLCLKRCDSTKRPLPKPLPEPLQIERLEQGRAPGRWRQTTPSNRATRCMTARNLGGPSTPQSQLCFVLQSNGLATIGCSFLEADSLSI
jgi:hypothetical protein